MKCAADAVHWMDTWAWTYDPRRDADGKLIGYVRFRMWPKQREVFRHIVWSIDNNVEALLEKSRDVGASYLIASAFLHHWLFVPGFKASMGSYSADLVDELDNPDALFTKLRIMLRRLPGWMIPVGFNPRLHDVKMRLTNPASGATITGAVGQEMGRGGRSTVFFVDEAAKVPHMDAVERALSGNTDCILWASTVNGMGNLFARKRHGILRTDQIMRLHWRDDPRKTEAWAQQKQASLSDPTAWASEYDIDYTASLEGVCIPAAWVESAKIIARMDSRVVASQAQVVIGGDVGAGKAKSVVVAKAGPVVSIPQTRLDPDTTETAHWMLAFAAATGAKILNFDSVGVGAGVNSTLSKRKAVEGLRVYPINVGLPASLRIWPDKRTSKEMFGNLKAEIWWLARTAFQRTHEHRLYLECLEGGKRHDPTELIAMPSGDRESDTMATQLSMVRWFKNEAGKIVIETKAQLTTRGVKSPDHAEAFVLLFADKRSRYTLDNL